MTEFKSNAKEITQSGAPSPQQIEEALKVLGSVLHKQGNACDPFFVIFGDSVYLRRQHGNALAHGYKEIAEKIAGMSVSATTAPEATPAKAEPAAAIGSKTLPVANGF